MNIADDFVPLWQQFLETFPEWNSEAHVTEMAPPGAPTSDPFASLDLMRAFTLWARAQGYATRDQARAIETICQRIEQHWAQAEGA